MQAVMILLVDCGFWGDAEVEHGGLRIDRCENSKSLQEKFDSGWLSLHVLSIP
jgi:hypothetical protein